MPSSYTAQQKAAIARFVGFTQVKESVAAKQLKNNGWNVEQAVDAYYQSAGSAAPTHSSSSISTLSKLFDKYRDPTDEPDRIGVEGSMRYFNDLGVPLDEPVIFTILAELEAPTMGELTKAGFVAGWTRMRADTISKQQQHIPSLRRGLTTAPDVFKKTYKATFILGRPAGSKVIPLEQAIEYWKLVLSPPSLQWSTSNTPWLDWWVEYLESKWKKAVGKDMWDQTGSFVTKSLEDESMSWWSEEGSWPGVIDEFVGFVKQKREQNGNMETE